MTETATTTRGTLPIVLAANQPMDKPYRGGEGIARLRGIEQPSEYSPEDFVGSVTELTGEPGVGLTVLPGGITLRDAIAADPVAFLGQEHVDRFGTSTMVLVKLLDTAERLFVHYHPDNDFAKAHLGNPLGKTEAWIIVATDERAGAGGAHAHLGFNRQVSESEVSQWFAGQDVPDMLGAMNRIELTVGDTLLVPGGLAHSIGAGITLVELQEPTDYSILLEYKGFKGLSAANALLGLDQATAFTGLDRRAWDAQQLAVLSSSGRRAAGDPGVGDSGLAPLFPEAADPFFRAERVAVDGSVELPAAFSILVVLEGEGTLGTDAGVTALRKGSTVLVPFGAGTAALEGRFTAIRCRPPCPAVA